MQIEKISPSRAVDNAFLQETIAEKDFEQFRSRLLRLLKHADEAINNQEELAKKVDQILTAKEDNPEADTSDLEAQIDQLVYELYGLSEEEIEIVEGSLGKIE